MGNVNRPVARESVFSSTFRVAAAFYNAGSESDEERSKMHNRIINNMRPPVKYGAGLSVLLMAFLLVGCLGPRKAQFGDSSQLTTPAPQATNPPPQATTPLPESLILREGDTVRIAFPGSGNLNTIQQIRRDGRISLPLVGDFKAAGMTPSNLEKELVKLIGIWFLARRAYSALRG